MTVAEAQVVLDKLQKDVTALASLEQFFRNRKEDKLTTDLEQYCNIEEPLSSVLERAVNSMRAGQIQLARTIENQRVDLPGNLYWLDPQTPCKK